MRCASSNEPLRTAKFHSTTLQSIAKDDLKQAIALDPASGYEHGSFKTVWSLTIEAAAPLGCGMSNGEAYLFYGHNSLSTD